MNRLPAIPLKTRPRLTPSLFWHARRVEPPRFTPVSNKTHFVLPPFSNAPHLFCPYFRMQHICFALLLMAFSSVKITLVNPFENMRRSKRKRRNQNVKTDMQTPVKVRVRDEHGGPWTDALQGGICKKSYRMSRLTVGGKCGCDATSILGVLHCVPLFPVEWGIGLSLAHSHPVCRYLRQENHKAQKVAHGHGRRTTVHRAWRSVRLAKEEELGTAFKVPTLPLPPLPAP